MVKLRLSRKGRKNLPIYWIVAADSRTPRDGRYIEQLGTHNPIKKETTLEKERILYWLRNGAQPSETVKNILSKDGLWKEFKSK